MNNDLKQLTDYLVALGIEKVPHTGTTFLGHLIAVSQLMRRAGCSEELCRAGLFHSIYGTQGFQGFALPVDDRPEVRALIGERAERLAYWNCAMDRASLEQALGQGTEPYRIRDRLSGEEAQFAREDFDDLCRVHLYDWLEQVPRSKLGWGNRRAVFRRMAERLGGPAQETYARVYAQEPAPVKIA
jgi:hypothetical protein